MNTASGSLTILNPHTPAPQVFWNGQIVEGLKSVKVDSDPSIGAVRVVLTLKEDPQIAEMQAAGIIVRRQP